MSLRHILLGFLNEPRSGYDLRQAFEDSVAHFWTANLSQIYPTLKAMEADAWLTSDKQPSSKGPARIVYSRTDLGRQALADWLLGGPCLQEQRNGFLAQVYFLDSLSEAEASAFFARVAQMSNWQNDRLSRRDKDMMSGFGDLASLPSDRVFKYAALDLGVRATRLYAQWASEWAARLAPDSEP